MTFDGTHVWFASGEKLSALAPADVAVNIDMAPNPSIAAWQGGVALANQPNIENLRVSRAQYLEKGGNALVETKLIASQ